MLTLPFPTQQDMIVIVKEKTNKESPKQLLKLIRTEKKTIIIEHVNKLFDTVSELLNIFCARELDDNKLKIKQVFVHLNNYCNALEAVKKTLSICNIPYWLVFGSITKPKKIKGLNCFTSKEDIEFLFFMSKIFEKRNHVALKELVSIYKQKNNSLNIPIQSIYRLINRKIMFIENIGIVEILHDKEDKRKKVIIKL